MTVCAACPTSRTCPTLEDPADRRCGVGRAAPDVPASTAIGSGAAPNASAPSGSEPDLALVPSLFAAHVVPDGQGVEELVGEHDGRPLGKRRRGVWCHVASVWSAGGEGLALRGREHRACLDEVHARCASQENPERIRAGAQRRPTSIVAPGRDPVPRDATSVRRFPSSQPDACAAHRPTSSPNIWLTSGAVMKSPARPNGIRGSCSSRGRDAAGPAA